MRAAKRLVHPEVEPATASIGMTLEAQDLSEAALQSGVDRLPEVRGGDRSRLAEDLLAFLAETLRLDLACLRLADPARDVVADPAGLPPDQVRALLASAARSLQPAPHAEGGLAILALPLGKTGVLLTGAKRQDFPRPRQRLLLTVAANQAALVLETPALASTRSESDLTQFIDMIPALAWAATPDGYPAAFNQYYLDYVGLSRDAMMGDGWAGNLHPDDLPALLLDWKAMMASRRAGTTQARLRGTDGQYRWFLFHANPLHDENGNVVRWFGVNTDIEDRKRVEEALLNTQVQLAHMTRVMTMGQLTASIAHELNQPLAGIITNAGTCLRMLGADPPNIEGALATARRTIRDGNRASEVITRLRALFSNKTTLAEPIDLNTAAQEVVALASTELQKANVSLRTRLAETLPPVTGDRVQLQQVILNLIMNATEAMSEIDYRPREIVVSTEREGDDHVRLSVQDVGIGFDAAAAEKLFAPFYTTKSSGMGIGLSVCRSIVEHHQGRIWAESNTGPGSTFRFSLPVLQDAAGSVEP